jgi:hypothetical protein
MAFAWLLLRQCAALWIVDQLYDGEPISLTYYGKIEPAGQMKGAVQVAPVALHAEFPAKKQ